VADGVGDRLLRQPVEGGVDRRPETVEVACELDVDVGPVPVDRGETLDVGDTALRGEVGLLAVAKSADHGAHLRQCP